MADIKAPESVKRRLKGGPIPKATPHQMMDMIQAMGSQRGAAKALGLHETTVCNALKPFRGTPEWNAMLDGMAKNRLEFNSFIAGELLNNREKIRASLKSATGKSYFTAIGIFMTNLNNASRSLDGSDQPVSPVMNFWNLPEKEQSDLERAIAKATSRLSVQTGAQPI